MVELEHEAELESSSISAILTHATVYIPLSHLCGKLASQICLGEDCLLKFADVALALL